MLQVFFNNLGSLHRSLGETGRAKYYLKRGMKIRPKKVGPENVDVASPYNNLGSLHNVLGKTDEAKDCYKRALEIRLKKPGPEHVDAPFAGRNS